MRPRGARADKIQTYQLDDRRVRALVPSADKAEAIRLCTSFAPADSNAAFDQYGKAPVALIATDTNAHSQDIATGERTPASWQWLEWGPAAAAPQLVLVGGAPPVKWLWHRFRDRAKPTRCGRPPHRAVTLMPIAGSWMATSIRLTCVEVVAAT